MDILAKVQTTAALNIIVPLMINTGAPDTGATLTIAAILPNGTAATFTAPTVTEVIAGSGVYKLVFPTDAATPLFTLPNEANPYTLLIKTATVGSTGNRAVRVYIVDRMPGEVALDSTVAKAATVALDATVAKAATVALDATVAKAATALTNVVWTDTKAGYLTGAVALDSTVAKAATVATAAGVAALQVTADAIPTLAEMEASTVLAKEAKLTFLQKCIKNKKKVKVIAGVLYLIIYDDDDVTEILRKAIKDVAGADVLDPAAGVIALENKTTV